MRETRPLNPPENWKAECPVCGGDFDCYLEQNEVTWEDEAVWVCDRCFEDGVVCKSCGEFEPDRMGSFCTGCNDSLTIIERMAME